MIFKLKQNFSVGGDINTANIKISDKYEINNLIANFLYKDNSFYLNEASWSFNHEENAEREFFNGELDFKQRKKNYDVDLRFKTRNASVLPRVSIMNYSFSEDNVSEIKTKFLINKNKNIFFKNLIIEDRDNNFQIKNLHLDKDYNLINFKEIQVKTSIDNNTNNEFTIINKDKIQIKGKIFDAKMLIKELSKDEKKNKFLKKISKDIEIDFNKIHKVAKFPIKDFRLVGKINRGSFEKISAKSDFEDSKHLDISLKKEEKTDGKILEVYSDIAMPLLSDYKFFQGCFLKRLLGAYF